MNEQAPSGAEIIVLPSGPVGILDCAEIIFRRLAKTRRMFSRGGVVVEVCNCSGISGETTTLNVVSPPGFRSRLENCVKIMAWHSKGRQGKDVLQSATCPGDMARCVSK